MPDRAHVNEAAQWAIETTPGTAVPANKTVRSMSIDIDVDGEAEVYRPDGHKWGSVVLPNAEWSAWSADGRPSYTEILYLLESICGTVTPTTVGTIGRKRIYTIQDTQADAAKTLTIEKGSSVRAAKIAYGLVIDHSFSFSRRGGVTMQAAGIGQLLTDGITMTATPSDVALVPIIGKQLDCYIDPTSGALGTTKLLRAFVLAPGVTGKYGPVWPINSALPSFDGHVELAPAGAATLLLEADAAGMAYLTSYRAGSLLFMRIKATGPEYESGRPYLFQYDACLGINRVRELARDSDGVSTVSYETEYVKDSTWTKAVEIMVENTLVAPL